MASARKPHAPHSPKAPQRDERGRFAPVVNVTVNVQQFPNGDLHVDAEADVVDADAVSPHAPIGFHAAEALEDGTTLDGEEDEG